MTLNSARRAARSSRRANRPITPHSTSLVLKRLGGVTPSRRSAELSLAASRRTNRIAAPRAAQRTMDEEVALPPDVAQSYAAGLGAGVAERGSRQDEGGEREDGQPAHHGPGGAKQTRAPTRDEPVPLAAARDISVG